MGTSLKSHSHGSTLVLTLVDPEQRNTLGPEVYAAGVEVMNRADSDAEIRSVVITGEGRNFSAGGNLQRLLARRQESPEVQAQSIDGLNAWIEAIGTLSKPVIAAVEGAAAGAGFSLALACDFIVAADNSVFVMAYSSVALSPDGGGSWQLGRQLPRAAAMELLMLGERATAPRLHELGLVTRVSPPGQALTRALELADGLNSRAPNTLASIKELVNSAPHATLGEQLQRERDHFVRNLHHANGGEGIQAFLDKRAARYR